jgi:hypothetical protein
MKISRIPKTMTAVKLLLAMFFHLLEEQSALKVTGLYHWLYRVLSVQKLRQNWRIELPFSRSIRG